MAWGVFNKIKKGFKKIGNVFKKGVNFLNDAVQTAAPIASAVANKILPGSGALINLASGALNALDNRNYGDAAQNVANFIQQGRIRTRP